ncbi:rho GTPase-activating protein 5-like [Olea europaea var. sylvestris]|uniref:rho GTPase-activating protein 5-like n=1 Tax=Olea europaea var. sylvestris TaxID=158386 RepID=UPI000C1D1FCC|nr:rho GTPase-activating protein 5-like [Olea europaea var. sylvestris]
MTEVLHSSSSSSSPSISTPTHNATLFRQTQSYAGEEGLSDVTGGDIEEEEEEENSVKEKREKDRRDQLSLLALLVTLFRKSFWLACKTDREEFSRGGSGVGSANCGCGVMEIGWPTDVQHVNHVTFDRFDGFLGLPVEFEPEVLRSAPSASATVFGVSTESMQLSYDPRGNSVPTILILLQRRLYAQGGLQVYYSFSAWFRELPRGVLDSLSPEEVMQCQSEEDCDALVRLLPSTEAALLDWAINLMVDVVQQEHLNKMNARNIAMVFAPNMTQMADPLTALMYAVQVMNFLKTLVEKTLRDREDSLIDPAPTSRMEHSDDNGHQDSSQLHLDNPVESNEDREETYIAEDPNSDGASDSNLVDNLTDEEHLTYSTSTEESDVSVSPAQVYGISSGGEAKVMNALQTQLDHVVTARNARGQRKKDKQKPRKLTYNLDIWNLNFFPRQAMHPANEGSS